MEPTRPSDANAQIRITYVVIPIIGIGLVLAVLTVYRYRRKRQMMGLFADGLRLEAGQRNYYANGERVIIVTNGAGGGRTRARAGGRRLGLGVGSREEGLNELGEAPPAYTPDGIPGPKPPATGVVGTETETGTGTVTGTGTEGGDRNGEMGIELTQYSQTAAEASMSRNPPDYGDEHTTSSPPPPPQPPVPETETGMTSEEARSRDATIATSTTNEPTIPPRAVLP